MLRLDADLYRSTRECLGALYPHVALGGLILIDARAVHEFLSQRTGRDRIRESPAGVAYIYRSNV